MGPDSWHAAGGLAFGRAKPQPAGRFEDTFMRWIAGAIGVLAVYVGTACPVRAGLYNTAEPKAVLSRKFKEFQGTTLIPLRQIGSTEVKVHSDLNTRYHLVAMLATRGVSPTLTVEQRLD